MGSAIRISIIATLLTSLVGCHSVQTDQPDAPAEPLPTYDEVQARADERVGAGSASDAGDATSATSATSAGDARGRPARRRRQTEISGFQIVRIDASQKDRPPGPEIDERAA